MSILRKRVLLIIFFPREVEMAVGEFQRWTEAIANSSGPLRQVVVNLVGNDLDLDFDVDKLRSQSVETIDFLVKNLLDQVAIKR